MSTVACLLLAASVTVQSPSPVLVADASAVSGIERAANTFGPDCGIELQLACRLVRLQTPTQTARMTWVVTAVAWSGLLTRMTIQRDIDAQPSVVLNSAEGQGYHQATTNRDSFGSEAAPIWLTVTATRHNGCQAAWRVEVR